MSTWSATKPSSVAEVEPPSVETLRRASLGDPGLASSQPAGVGTARSHSPARLACVLVGLGLLACALRYALCFPLIPDEAALTMSIARRGYAGLLGELDFGQMAPPAFLLLVEACTRAFGLHEWSLRLAAFVAVVASIAVYPLVVRRVLAGWGFVLAVGIFAVSYWPMRYGSEVKPYGLDMLVACLWLLLALRWLQGQRRWPWAVAMLPLAVAGFALSFPSVFVGGGAVMAMGLDAVRRRRVRDLWTPVVVGLALLAGFAGAYAWLVPARSETARWMADYWHKAFPPADDPLGLGWYLLRVGAGELMPYPVGGENFASLGTLACVLVGLAWLVRRGRWTLVVLLLGPVVLALAAGLMQRYPFGQPTRLQLYLAPALCLLAGQGLALLLGRLQAWVRAPAWRSPQRVAFVLLASIPVVSMVRDVLQPYKTTTDLALRRAAQVVWSPAHRGGPRALSLREDLHGAFVDEPQGMHSELTRFLANYYMRAPDAGRGVVPAGRAVQVVAYHLDSQQDADRRRAWIEAFCQAHGLRYVGSASLHVAHVDKHERLLRMDEIELLRFEPAGGPPEAADRDASAPAVAGRSG
ncbi:MAG: hypothetical protein KatS3mg103_1015 [Phycisphaerales bacterium]|nr:MAG: hypothetical protein KatS3mg103_1015 [Phycisphaerales bacterium]